MTLPSISRALKTVRRIVFAPRDADAGLRLAVTASGCAPWAGLAFCDRCACFGFLFPPQAAVASAAGCSIPVWVTIYARHQHGLAAHVGLQDLGDGDAAVSLQVVLEEGDQHARRGDDRCC